MKRASVCLLVLFAVLLTVPAYAATPRAISIIPDIVFDGTEASCSARIIGNNMSDTISATMTLKRGNTLIDEWSGSGNGTIKLSGTADVNIGQTYTLIVNATINGIAQPTVTIYRTNS